MEVFQNENESSDTLENSCPSCKADSNEQSSSMVCLIQIVQHNNSNLRIVQTVEPGSRG